MTCLVDGLHWLDEGVHALAADVIARTPERTP